MEISVAPVLPRIDWPADIEWTLRTADSEQYSPGWSSIAEVPQPLGRSIERRSSIVEPGLGETMKEAPVLRRAVGAAPSHRNQCREFWL